MNYVLYLILCSGVTNSCLEPYRYPDYFVDGYSCMLAGNNESILKLEEIGNEKVNENKIYIKFVCREETKDEVDT
tara:strand:+ start:155 stop:379 length:225 start_codon:yes stop_codon:yes gene_type:complete